MTGDFDDIAGSNSTPPPLPDPCSTRPGLQIRGGLGIGADKELQLLHSCTYPVFIVQTKSFDMQVQVKFELRLELTLKM